MSDKSAILEYVINTAKNAGGDACDALLYDSTSISVSRRMGKPEGLERSESTGLSLRVFVGKGSATVSSSDISKQALQEAIERAVAMAKLAPQDEFAGIASQELLAKQIIDLDLYDKNEPDTTWLQQQCQISEDAALAVKGVSNSEGADASYGSYNFALATSNGFFGSYNASNSSISVSVLAGQDADMQRDYDFTSARFLTELSDPMQLGINAAKGAIAKLNPKKIATAALPIIFDRRVSKSIISAFAGAINGASIAKGTSFLKDSLEKAVFASNINIIDDPLIIRGQASKPFDGEGLAAVKRNLVENGILQTWLLDIRSANKLGLQPTGNASRGLSSPPSPSASNLYLANGAASFKDLFAGVKNGFYVNQLFGMGVNLLTGDYSQGASGFMIENGEITYPVSEVTIAGKLSDMFMNLTAANDLEFRYATNAPTIRIDGMTIAGK